MRNYRRMAWSGKTQILKTSRWQRLCFHRCKVSLSNLQSSSRNLTKSNQKRQKEKRWSNRWCRSTAKGTHRLRCRDLSIKIGLWVIDRTTCKLYQKTSFQCILVHPMRLASGSNQVLAHPSRTCLEPTKKWMRKQIPLKELAQHFSGKLWVKHNSRTAHRAQGHARIKVSSSMIMLIKNLLK